MAKNFFFRDFCKGFFFFSISFCLFQSCGEFFFEPGEKVGKYFWNFSPYVAEGME